MTIEPDHFIKQRFIASRPHSKLTAKDWVWICFCIWGLVCPRERSILEGSIYSDQTWSSFWQKLKKTKTHTHTTNLI